MSVFIVKLTYFVYTILYSPFLKLKRVQHNGLVWIAGWPCFRNSGSILIGSNCRFMSRPTGNMIGLNHPCILATENVNAAIKIGNNCGFSGASIWCFDRITLGNRVRVGANCLIMDGDAHQDDPRAGKNSPIIIEDNVWLGANVVVTKGVTIGRNSIVGINSLVLKDIPANVVAAGNPCRVIRNLTNEEIYKIECK